MLNKIKTKIVFFFTSDGFKIAMSLLTAITLAIGSTGFKAYESSFKEEVLALIVFFLFFIFLLQISGVFKDIKDKNS
ncbi:hypothetical protein ACFL1Y_00895 [Patescibacteria group bacterium]